MNDNELRRYTNLPSVLRILRQRAITLLPPDTWDDVNDRRLLAAYQQCNQFKTLLALCFSEAAETYHHWKVFSPGAAGVCIVFNRSNLLPSFQHDGLCFRKVRYYTVEALSSDEPILNDLPFSKRAAYRDEQEYRVIYAKQGETLRSKDVSIQPSAIDRVIINPWLPEVLAEEIRNTMLQVQGFKHLSVVQSRVTDGSAWRQLADKHSQFSTPTS